MPGSGLEAARCIARDHPSIRVVILSSSERLEDIAEALSAGVKAYVIKGIRGHELIELVRSIATTFLMLLTVGI